MRRSPIGKFKVGYCQNNFSFFLEQIIICGFVFFEVPEFYFVKQCLAMFV
jgi:hypothetical protein